LDGFTDGFAVAATSAAVAAIVAAVLTPRRSADAPHASNHPVH
jgi:hypothetical protein